MDRHYDMSIIMCTMICGFLPHFGCWLGIANCALLYILDLSLNQPRTIYNLYEIRAYTTKKN